MEIAEKIKSLRTKERYNQTALAKIIGVKPNTIWRWENGRAKPKVEQIMKLAKALNVSPEIFLMPYESQNPNSENSQLANNSKQNIDKLIEKLSDENSELEEPVTGGMTKNKDMLIIQDGTRQYLIPNNEEGRKLFITVMAAGFQGIGVPVVSNAINGNNNSGNQLGVTHH